VSSKEEKCEKNLSAQAAGIITCRNRGQNKGTGASSGVINTTNRETWHLNKNMNTPCQELLRRRLANTEMLATAAVALHRRSLTVSCLVMLTSASADQSEALQIYWLLHTRTVSYSVLVNHRKYKCCHVLGTMHKTYAAESHVHFTTVFSKNFIFVGCILLRNVHVLRDIITSIKKTLSCDCWYMSERFLSKNLHLYSETCIRQNHMGPKIFSTLDKFPHYTK
jgi:hypothetical protein